MVQKCIGWVAALATRAARELARMRGVSRQLVELFGQAPFQGQQVCDIGRCCHGGSCLRDQPGKTVNGHGKYALFGPRMLAPVQQQVAKARRL